jgi:succinate dehydrogenase / fumarate reductase cytochrome b subunit
MSNKPSSKNFLRWFNPLGRQPGTWAFILNRITALGLTLYLGLHLVMLGKLAQGPEAYDAFINLAKAPVFVLGEILVVAGGFIHGINGIRISATSFGLGVRHQKSMFFLSMAVAIPAIMYFAWRMLFGE